MLKGIYDVDCVTWSPQGKLFQVDYAKEAVKNGSLCLALRSKTHAVLCTIKRNPTELATYQDKVFKVDDHIGMGISGIAADARVLCKYMRRECITHRNTFANQLPPKRLVEKVAGKAQARTYTYGGRPFGVSLLVIFYDQDGPYVYEVTPGGDCQEYNAFSIGARAQSARTYFEDHLDRFGSCDVENLILNGVKALTTGYRDDEELTGKNVEISYVGKDGFVSLNEEEINSYLAKVEEFNPSGQMVEEN